MRWKSAEAGSQGEVLSELLTTELPVQPDGMNLEESLQVCALVCVVVCV